MKLLNVCIVVLMSLRINAQEPNSKPADKAKVAFIYTLAIGGLALVPLALFLLARRTPRERMMEEAAQMNLLMKKLRAMAAKQSKGNA